MSSAPKLVNYDDGSNPSVDVESLETLGRMVCGISHDFNNVLTGVLVYSDLLIAELSRGKGEDRKQMLQFAQHIKGAGERGADLVARLMSVSSPLAGGRQRVSWNEAVTEAVELLSHVIAEDVEIVVELKNDIRGSTLSGASAQQVVLNLALNARDAMPNGGRLSVQTGNCSLEGRLGSALTVADTGCGMDELTLSRVFDPFYTTKAPGCGTGLGLANIEKLVRKHEGKITVQSELGRGTTMTIWLPEAGTSGIAIEVGKEPEKKKRGSRS